MAAAAAAEPAPELVQAVVDGVLPEGVLAGDLQYAVLADQSGNMSADLPLDAEQRPRVAMGQLSGVQVAGRPHRARAVRRLQRR